MIDRIRRAAVLVGGFDRALVHRRDQTRTARGVEKLNLENEMRVRSGRESGSQFEGPGTGLLDELEFAREFPTQTRVEFLRPRRVASAGSPPATPQATASTGSTRIAE